MKGKRYGTDEKIRILREAETVDKSIAEVLCKEKGISEQTFHRPEPPQVKSAPCLITPTNPDVSGLLYH